MDTVGAWLVHKLERDRGAEIVGATEDQQLLIDQVAEADKPMKVRREDEPRDRASSSAKWATATQTAIKTLVGLLGFFGALLISTSQHHPPSAPLPAATPSSSGSTWSACARSASSA